MNSSPESSSDELPEAISVLQDIQSRLRNLVESAQEIDQHFFARQLELLVREFRKLLKEKKLCHVAAGVLQQMKNMSPDDARLILDLLVEEGTGDGLRNVSVA